MTFEEFISRQSRPLYVWRMAIHSSCSRLVTPTREGARKRVTKAQREIDDLVLARAETIKKERSEP